MYFATMCILLLKVESKMHFNDIKVLFMGNQLACVQFLGTYGN